MENTTATVSKSEMDSLEAWISRLKQREVARQKNAAPSYDEFTKLVEARKLDTTVKKCTALVRKFVSTSTAPVIVYNLMQNNIYQ